jgi:hypothetical protein
MVAKLVLDEISSSGSNITIDATKTFTVNGSLLSAGSTNILHKTGDYPIVEADVSGKSELIITTTTATPRDITLPLVGVTGAATCIITVVVSADATGTQSVRVMNGASEAWTGYQKGDFVKFCVSDGAWVVLDHKETMFSSRTLTADLVIAPSATTKPTGYTNVTDIGQVWDNVNNKLVAPFAGIWDLNWRLNTAEPGAESQTVPVIYAGGAMIYTPGQGTSASGHNRGMNQATLRIKVAASTDIEFYSHNALDTGTWPTLGGNASNETGFDGTFTRTY